MPRNSLDVPINVLWIGSDHAFDLHEVYLRFRSPAGWELARQPEKAELFITADSRYKLWVNGEFVARGPARGWPHAQVVDALDIAPYLKPGANLLAIQVYQPGYSHFAYVHRGAAGLLAYLVCDGETVLVTDTAWRTRRDGSFASLTPRMSIYQAGVEQVDLNRAEDWMAVGFDDGGWASARAVAPAFGYPWQAMQPRSVPLLVERELQPDLRAVRGGESASDPDPHLALRQGWMNAEPISWVTDADGWFTPQLQAGQSAYWLYELGRGYTCQGWAEVEGADGVEQVSISYTEKWRSDNPAEPYLSDPATYCRVRMTDRFCLRAGEQRVEGYGMRGGRLVLFQLTGPTAPGFRIRFHVTVSEYPLEITRALTTSDPLLNDVIAMCENTLAACLSDGFVDNPWREHAQWVGDPLIDSQILAAMTDDLRPMRRVIELAAEGAYADGILPGVLPSEALAYVIVDFNFQWLELLYEYQRLSGDADFVRSMWPAAIRMIDRFLQDIGPEGLLLTPPGRRLFLDWSTMSKLEPNAIYNLHFLWALQLAAQLAQQIGAEAEAARWAHEAGRLQPRIRDAFWDGARWWDDAQRTTYSQLATSLAILTRTTKAEEAPALLAALASRSLDPEDESPNPGARPANPDRMVLASPYMHHRVFQALRLHDRWQDVIEIIKLRWGRWTLAGFPTTWENWNVDFPDGSECHGFSAHPRFHLAEIAKKRPTLNTD
ncbi:MAG: alpha-L-rhamnosidase N-terminal domain-containing protein [Caldilineales bacterium]|nr:alpha-L-rhamnosidase N-terminal domain-containing protein [Caldilineales bacterium]